MAYKVNTIIKCKVDGETIKERILWIGQEYLYVIDINSNRFPYLKSIEEVEANIKNGNIKMLSDDPYIIVMDEDHIPIKHKKKRDFVWELIKDVVVKEPEIFQSKFRRKVIREMAQKNNIGETTIVGYMKRYWIRGKIPNALLPDYRNCGARGKERVSGNVKRGRPRIHQDVNGIGINVTEDIKKIFRIAINKFYYTTAKHSLALTYELMRKEYFIKGFKEKNGIKTPILKPQSEIPSFGQFRYWFEKERNIKREISSRYNNKKYQKSYRAIPGSNLEGILQPGTYEIDCQIGDIYLVSRFNRNWIIGRPAIYIVIDKFSRAVCGVYIGLETGSYLGAMMALVNAITDKVKFCKDYNINIKEEEWPMHYLPDTIIADRGELQGKHIENLINMLNVNIQNTPPYRADLKSTVERFFGLMNERIKPFLPGTIDLDGRERGDKDYRLKSKLDLHQFTQVVIKSILFHNNHYHLDYYKRDKFMIEDDVLCIPNNLWNWGIANRGGTLRSVPEDMAKLALLPSESGTITPKGIKFKDMYYANSTILKGQDFINARRNGITKVNVSYDPRNINYIYVRDDKLNSFEKYFLLESSNRYKDRYLEEIEYLLESEKVRILKNSDSEAQAKINLITEIEKTVEEAEDMYKKEANYVDTNRKRLKNIRENRRIEKALRRSQEFFELENRKEDIEKEIATRENCNDEIVTRESFNEGETTLDLLFKKQKEQFRNE